MNQKTWSQLVKIREESIHKSKKAASRGACSGGRETLTLNPKRTLEKDELWGQGSSIHISILYYLVCSDRQIINIIIINHHLRSVPLRYGVEVSVRCKKGAVWTPALPAFRMFSFNQTLIFFLPTFRKANPGGQTVALCTFFRTRSRTFNAEIMRREGLEKPYYHAAIGYSSALSS